MYCSRSEHCIAEVRDKFRTWGVDPTHADQVIEHLIEERFIDEQRFATAYVRDKYRFNHWGKTKIAAMLASKRVPRDIIDAALAEEIDDDQYSESLEEILRSKLRTTKAATSYELRAKLFRFAASRGYDPTTITKTLSHLLTDTDDEEPSIFFNKNIHQ